jgi:primary-amine oxidase
MALDRLKSVADHVAGTRSPPHPFDPLSNAEIETAAHIIRKEHGKVHYNAITLLEPPKKEMLKWLEDPARTPRPARIADVVAIAPGGKVYDGLVNLEEGKITKWTALEGVQPLVSFKGARKNNKRADQARSQWRTYRLLSTFVEKTPKLLNSV